MIKNYDEKYYFIEGSHHKYIMSAYHDLQEDIFEMFMALKETCQPLFAYNMRTRMRTLIVTNEPKLLQQDGKINFNGNLYWYCKFVRDNLNWSYKKFTWTTRKLPKD